jgi:amino-acid racemase
MQTIGLIGGMSWESTLVYYRLINEEVRRRLGGLHSAELLLASVDFAPIERMQVEDRWDDAAALLAATAERLERGGADFLILGTNTMHRVAPAIEARVRLPLLHIADPTGEAIRGHDLRRVGLLGTRFTMEQPFYRERLAERFGLEVLVPDETDRARVHEVIYDELCLGRVLDASRRAFGAIARGLAARGAQAIVLGCTEIGMLVGDADVPVPVFDTTALHALAAVARALQPRPGL